MARNFLFGLGWMLIVTAVLSSYAAFAPDTHIPLTISYAISGVRVVVALVVFYFANKCVVAANRWPAIGMWLLGFIVGFPLGNLVINGTAFAAVAALR